MVKLICCECGEEFEYKEWNYEPSKWNAFNKKCRKCQERIQFKIYLYNNNIILDDEQFEMLYLKFKELKDEILKNVDIKQFETESISMSYGLKL